MKSDHKWNELNSEIIECRLCSRLVAWREQVAREKKRAYRDQEYWGRPVPGFGDIQAKILVVGLAPGAHGSNRTGRMFTGDASGDFLYPALFRAGFASKEFSRHSEDSMVLKNIFISALCRCAPPKNKPTPAEVLACQPFLIQEIRLLPNLEGIVALGRLAFEQVSKLIHLPPKSSFYHGGVYHSNSKPLTVIASYHPSRQNTQTKRLTVEMFDTIWQKAREIFSS